MMTNNMKGKHKDIPSNKGPWKQFRDLNIYANPFGELKYKQGKSEYKFRYYDFYSRNNTDAQNVIVTKHKRYYVKRIVWECFNGIIPDNCAIVHKFGSRNDALYNLKIIDSTEYSKQNSKRIKARFVIDKTHNRMYKSSREAAKYLKIDKTTVCRYCNGKIKEPAYDLHWGGLISGADL